MQGSVEKSSFSKMKSIKKYGTYTIGSRASGVIATMAEAIHLNLQSPDVNLPQNKYSLEELRDLESKLVLITGRESKERESVDQFLNVRIYIITWLCSVSIRCFTVLV